MGEFGVLELIAFAFRKSTNLIGSVSSVSDAILGVIGSVVWLLSFVALLVVDLSGLDDCWSGASSDFLPSVEASLLTLLLSPEGLPATKNRAFLWTLPQVVGAADSAPWYA